MKILLASNNKFKTEESKRIIKNIDPCIEVYQLSDLGINVDPDETGETYQENAKIKAEAIFEELKRLNIEDNYIVISDDCGVEIKALNWGPGIYSHRYIMGSKNMSKVLDAMIPFINKEERFAKYCGGMYMIRSGKNGNIDTLYVETFTPGFILFEEKGSAGFSYDFVFAPIDANYSDDIRYMKTFSELSRSEKDAISFRGKNLRAIINYLLIINN